MSRGVSWHGLRRMKFPLQRISVSEFSGSLRYGKSTVGWTRVSSHCFAQKWRDEGEGTRSKSNNYVSLRAWITSLMWSLPLAQLLVLLRTRSVVAVGRYWDIIGRFLRNILRKYVARVVSCGTYYANMSPKLFHEVHISQIRFLLAQFASCRFKYGYPPFWYEFRIHNCKLHNICTL